MAIKENCRAFCLIVITVLNLEIPNISKFSYPTLLKKIFKLSKRVVKTLQSLKMYLMFLIWREKYLFYTAKKLKGMHKDYKILLIKHRNI
jgi:hypothetical protein